MSLIATGSQFDAKRVGVYDLDHSGGVPEVVHRK
jgi:hypothetical protein